MSLAASLRSAARPFTSLNGVMREHPVKTSVIITGTKAGLADLMVQSTFEQRKLEELDKRRLLTFLLFGAFYQGGFQYFLFNHVFERWLPGTSLKATGQKVLAANLIADPLFFFPCFYTLKEALSKRPEEALCVDTVRVALTAYYNNCFADWRNTWGVWFPGHLVTYGVMPLHLRMPWIAAVSFGYLSVLSITRGNNQPSSSSNSSKECRLSGPRISRKASAATGALVAAEKEN